MLQEIFVLLLPAVRAVGLLFVEIVLVGVRDERGLCALFEDARPIDVTKPNVLFDLFRAVEAEAVCGLALKAFVDEVCGLERPAFRDVVAFDLDLSCENCISYFFSTLSGVRSLPHHKLISYHSHCKIVYRHPVVLPAHDLWSHVAWRSTRLV